MTMFNFPVRFPATPINCGHGRRIHKPEFNNQAEFDKFLIENRPKMNYSRTSQFTEAKSLLQGVIDLYVLLMRYEDGPEYWQWFDGPELYYQPRAYGAEPMTTMKIGRTQGRSKPSAFHLRDEIHRAVFASSGTSMDVRDAFVMCGGEFLDNQMRAVRKIFKNFNMVKIKCTSINEMSLFQKTTKQSISRTNLSPFYVGPFGRNQIDVPYSLLFFSYYNSTNEYQFVISDHPSPHFPYMVQQWAEMKYKEFGEAEIEMRN